MTQLAKCCHASMGSYARSPRIHVKKIMMAFISNLSPGEMGAKGPLRLSGQFLTTDTSSYSTVPTGLHVRPPVPDTYPPRHPTHSFIFPCTCGFPHLWVPYTCRSSAAVGPLHLLITITEGHLKLQVPRLLTLWTACQFFKVPRLCQPHAEDEIPAIISLKMRLVGATCPRVFHASLPCSLGLPLWPVAP